MEMNETLRIHEKDYVMKIIYYTSKLYINQLLINS